MVIDAFIKLKNAHEVQNAENGSTELCMVFGTKLPFEYAEEVVAVGNSANAAVSASRLGLFPLVLLHMLEMMKTDKKKKNAYVNLNQIKSQQNLLCS